MRNTQPFAQLPLRPELQQGLAELNFDRMTPVQAAALPPILAGRDVLARANTGSGKTAAFGLGLLQALNPKAFRVQSLVLCPTRELAEQVCVQLRQLAKALPNVKVLTLCGGVSIGPQIGSLQHSAHIVVGTPGRVLKHLGKRTLTLAHLQTLVLDEADRMLDMGFTEELEAILQFVPTPRQTLLFSATYPDAIAQISQRVQRDAVVLDVATAEAPPKIEQLWLPVTADNESPALSHKRGAAQQGQRQKLTQQRLQILLAALQQYGGATNLVFCNTKVDCSAVAAYLAANGVAVLALHGDLDQPQRTAALVQFANGSASVLVATDVAARGLDITGLAAVVNYELPSQAEVYVHRIGRTGRAGEAGVAVSLVASQELHRLSALAQLPQQPELKQQVLPETVAANPALAPAYITLEINGGRKHKLRAGDIVGALTAGGAIAGDDIGKIELSEVRCFVAVALRHQATALRLLNRSPIKGRQFRARPLAAN